MVFHRRPPSFQQVLVSRDLGGAGLVALHFSEYLNRRNESSRVWIPGAGAAMNEAERLHLDIEQYDASSLFNSSRLGIGCANWRIGRKLARLGPGIVHVHGPSHYGALRLGLQLSGLKRVAHVQIEESDQLLRWAFKTPPELIITCARFLEAHVRRNLPEPYRERQKIVAVPNSVDTDRFFPSDKREAKRKVGAPLDVPLVLMLANLAPHKGQETTIRAVAALRDRNVHVVCWLAGIERNGATEYTARLQDQIQSLGVGDRVHLLGFRCDAPDLLRAADFFLLPSTCEGLPLSILEAQATRVAVLAAPTAGIPEVIEDQRTGFLVPAGDADGYARCIQQLLAEPGLYQSLVEAAHTQARREYTWQVLCDRIWSEYQELLADRTQARSKTARSVAFCSRILGIGC